MNHEMAADVLDTAADLIERDGWVQGSMFSEEDVPTWPTEGDSHKARTVEYRERMEEWESKAPACLLGALRKAVTALNASHSNWENICRDRIEKHLGLHTLYAPAWNDRPGRTKQEVLDVLRATSKEERKLADAES